MSHYTFPGDFRALYDHALAAYAAGKRDAATLFNAAQSVWIAANGLSAQAFYDYAEDEHSAGLPGFGHALTIETVRRDYFLNAQGGRASSSVADPDTWPGKHEAVHGITWLPRILPKTRAKLRGELPASMMYCCGGDRLFFKTHDILPAEFLSLVWRHENDDAAIIAWVAARSRATETANGKKV
jgi:Domain of unknown function (DUF5069)